MDDIVLFEALTNVLTLSWCNANKYSLSHLKMATIKSLIFGDQYRLIEKIGQGSFGKVYLAIDKFDSSKQVAVKTEKLSQPFSQLVKEI